jgi:hypothetical protein
LPEVVSQIVFGHGRSPLLELLGSCSVAACDLLAPARLPAVEKPQRFRHRRKWPTQLSAGTLANDDEAEDVFDDAARLGLLHGFHAASFPR